MSPSELSSRVPPQLSRGILIAALPLSLDARSLELLRHDVLKAAPEREVKGIVLDAAAVHVLDSEDFRDLCKTLRMCEAMGKPAVLCGLTPGVVSSLVELGVDTASVTTTRSVESALIWLAARRS